MQQIETLYPPLAEFVRMPEGTAIVLAMGPEDKKRLSAFQSKAQAYAYSAGATITTRTYLGRAVQDSDCPMLDFLVLTVVKSGKARREQAPATRIKKLKSELQELENEASNHKRKPKKREKA